MSFKQSFFLGLLGFGLGRCVLFISSQFDSSHFVVELSKFIVFLDVSRRLVRQRHDELINLQGSGRHPLIHLHQPPLSHHLVYRLSELNNINFTFPPVYPSVT